jgi:hypothetical protein
MGLVDRSRPSSNQLQRFLRHLQQAAATVPRNRKGGVMSVTRRIEQGALGPMELERVQGAACIGLKSLTGVEERHWPRDGSRRDLAEADGGDP